MAENVTKYNLRPSTKLKVVKEPCLTCRDDTEEETIPLFPDRVAIVPETSESNEVDQPGCSTTNTDVLVDNFESVVDSEGVNSIHRCRSDNHSKISEVCSMHVNDHTQVRVKSTDDITLNLPEGGKPVRFRDSQNDYTESHVESIGPKTQHATSGYERASLYPRNEHPTSPIFIKHNRQERQLSGLSGRSANYEPGQTLPQTFPPIDLQRDPPVISQFGGWGDFSQFNPVSVPPQVPRNLTNLNEFTGPKVKLPTFNGKSEWESFWVQFDFFCEQYGWNERDKLAQLMSSLRETAIQYVARLPPAIRNSFESLVESLRTRFGDHVLPETHRASLNNLRKNPKESLHEFAARVSELVSKAYPGLDGSQLHTNLTIETTVKGLQDPTLTYDVLTKKPHTINQALDMIAWHECCKGTTRRRNVVRQVFEDDEGNDFNMRRINDGSFVTEERLDKFGKELQQAILSAIKGVMNPNKPERRTRQNDITCYFCYEPGHFRRECPKNRLRTDRLNNQIQSKPSSSKSGAELQQNSEN